MTEIDFSSDWQTVAPLRHPPPQDMAYHAAVAMIDRLVGPVEQHEQLVEWTAAVLREPRPAWQDEIDAFVAGFDDGMREPPYEHARANIEDELARIAALPIPADEPTLVYLAQRETSLQTLLDVALVGMPPDHAVVGAEVDEQGWPIVFGSPPEAP